MWCVKAVKFLAIPHIVFVLLGGCASTTSIPVVERPQPPSERINTHWVSEGETLYAIAWRYNMDVATLAQANRLDSEYTIYRGQTLRLDLKRAIAEQKRVKARNQGTSVVSHAGRQIATKKTVSNASQKLYKLSTNKLGTWRWPTKGGVLKRFSYVKGLGHKGLDIDGSRGQPVYATQKGIVVYAGEGLPAYGKLLIVKHPEAYLSAYAHNSRLIVKEGDTVVVGQKVAEVGQSGTTHQHLHFEIRKKGVPVDPLKLLPRA